MTMRIKAALVIMAIVFAFTASCFLLSLFFTRYNMTAAMEQEISLAMDIADTVVSTKISLLKSNGETLAERLKAVPDAKMQEVMAAQLEEFTDFFALTVFDKNGVIASKGTPITTADMLEEREYIQIAYEGDIVLSSTLYDDETLEFIMYVFVPMDSGRILGATIPGLFFSDLLSEYRLWQTGNIFMTDAEGTFLANYRPYLVLEKHNFIEDAKTDPELKTAGEFYREMISKDNGSGKYFFGGEERLCVYKRITGSVTGWYIGVAAPLNEGPQKNIRRGLLLASLLFLAVGIIVSVFVSAVAIKPFKTIQAQAAQIHGEHERARLLLDATPLACRLWDKDYKIFDYNEESLKLFNLKDGQEFVDRYYDLSPEYQPDGQSTREKTVKMLNKAFKEGRCVFEWMNQTLDGTPIPTEVTLVRVPYGNDHAVAGYSRDLREQKQMMGELERRDYLMNIINDAAGILLRSEIDAFAEDLHSCMGVIAEALGMDRISIWKNYREDGLLYYSQAFEWGAGLESHKNKAGAYNKYSSVKEPRCYSKVVPSWEETLSKGININRLL
ncbi:MAG: PAS domain-containing protein, partial [Clostridiales bacterium]|nr:PAS domain-containing protein [Clostridiales bacterium]